MGEHVSLQKAVYVQAEVCSGLISSAARTAWYTVIFALDL